MLRSSKVFKITGRKKKLPKVLQLPITTKCNSKCVMCNIPNMDSSDELNVGDFKMCISDPVFKEIEGVGINGGEPSLVKDIVERAEILLEDLPKLKHLNIISNGFLTDRLLTKLQKIYNACKKKSVKFHVAISLDGVADIHDSVRGVPGVFAKTINTIREIKIPEKYCDSYDVGCTVVQQNVHHLSQLYNFAQKNDIKIKFRLGIPNKRIESQLKLQEYSIWRDKGFLQSAKEFFYMQYRFATNLVEKYKYFAIFRFLAIPNSKRILGCSWQDKGITMDPKGNIYYCAVESKSLGNLKSNNGLELFFCKDNIKYREEIIMTKCDMCIHDYSGDIRLGDFMLFLKELISERVKMRTFK